MKDYFRNMARRKRALAQCRQARADLHAALGQAVDAYQVRPWPVLGVAAGAGFVLARLEAGRGAVRAGLRIATGPGWRLVRQYLVI